MHFPDNDPRWKGADSLLFLRHARDLVRKQGFELVNVDTTVILERPKLKDYRLTSGSAGVDAGYRSSACR